jgi:putative ABC transport system permease protein
VVEDTRQRLDEPPGGEIYLPLLQTAQLSTHWLIRSRHPVDEVERRVRHVLRAIDPQQPADNFRTLASLRDDSLLPSRVTASVVSLFSLLALLITATGIGGVIGFAVQQRRHEFGVRLALGAQRHRLVAMVVGDGLRLVCIGLSLGGAASLTMFPVMRSALAGVRRFDPASLLLVSALLLAVAAAACFIPARRAARVDPLLALRAN